MTNEQLLQQAKDQVAKLHMRSDKNWEDLVNYLYGNGFHQRVTEILNDEVIPLAIQSAREEAAPKWIPITDGPPPDGTKVLISFYRSRDIRMASYSFVSHGGHTYNVNGGTVITSEISHWMFLPVPPVLNPKN